MTEIFPYDILKEQRARITVLEANLEQFKELAETQAKSAEDGWIQVRELEAAIREFMKGDGCTSDLVRALGSELETGGEPDVHG